VDYLKFLHGSLQPAHVVGVDAEQLAAVQDLGLSSRVPELKLLVVFVVGKPTVERYNQVDRQRHEGEYDFTSVLGVHERQDGQGGKTEADCRGDEPKLGRTVVEGRSGRHSQDCLMGG